MTEAAQTVSVDCRGQQYPKPIVSTAKAANKLAPSGGRLEILSDDDAFPLEVRKWCQRSGAELMELSTSDQGHRAVVHVRSKVQVPSENSAPQRSADRRSTDERSADERSAPQRSVPQHSVPQHSADKHAVSDRLDTERPASAPRTPRQRRRTKPEGMHAVKGAKTGKSAKSEQSAKPERSAKFGQSAKPSQSKRNATKQNQRAAQRRRTARTPQTASSARSQQGHKPRSHTLDCRGMQCPAPILEVARAARQLGSGGMLEVLADDDVFALDIKTWCRSAGAKLQTLERTAGDYRAVIQTANHALRSGERLVSRRRAAGERHVVAHANTIPAPPANGLDDDSSPPPTTMPAALPDDPRTPQQRGSKKPTSGIKKKVVDLKRCNQTQFVTALKNAGEIWHDQQIQLIAADTSFNGALLKWCTDNGHMLRSLNGEAPMVAEIKLARRTRSQRPSSAPKSAGRSRSATASLKEKETTKPSVEPVVLNKSAPKQALLLLVHRDEDALRTALLVAENALASGLSVTLFFSARGVELLRERPAETSAPPASWLERLRNWLTAKRPALPAAVSQDGRPSTDGPQPIKTLLEAARASGVKYIACQPDLDALGIKASELHTDVEFGNLSAFVEDAPNAAMTLVF